jgi:glycosyltransferase involved in cell wall biosynthesis
MTQYQICICICSFKRPHLLKRTLESLRNLTTQGLFDYSIVVADNDHAESARSTVEGFAGTTAMQVVYCVEPEQNISLARNKALEFAKGDLVAWIDDDEVADNDWLLFLFRALEEFKTDGVLGPVRPIFESKPPTWIIKGRFFDKPRRATGLKLQWHQASTANVLVRRHILAGIKEPFRREFGSGCEDIDFFKRMIEGGRTFAWCDEAIVSEIVPPARWSRHYLFRRAFLRGRNGSHFADFFSAVKSIIAIPLYLILLPFLLLAGYHLFVRFLMKIGDHSGKIFGLIGLNLMGDKYLAG